jgi:DNA-binding CsgD family transcriptional regulator
MDRLLDGISRGESGSLVVRAEAGMGKTSLLRYAAERAASMTVLRVTGVEAEADLDFAGLHNLLRPIVTELPQLPGPQHDALAAALGLAPSRYADRFLVSAGVLSLLAAAAEGRPVVCLIDDAQWLDVPSADALVFTARRLGAESVGILFAAREGERRSLEAPGLEALHLAGIDRVSAATLLERSAPDAVPWVRERLLSDAAGNPLALLELPAALSGEQLAGRASLPETLPLTERLRDSFMQRIRRLPEPTQAALLIAAAEDTGQRRIIDRAAAELGLSQDALDPAEEIAMVRTHDGTLTFRHPLVRSAVYESATPGRRRGVHNALAGALTSEGREDRSVWHRAMATEAADEELAGALEALAHQSQRRGGHASAATAFERAAEISGSEPARGHRLASAAEAAFVAGQVDRATDLVGRALQLTEAAERARLLYLSGLISAFAGSLPRALAALLEGLEVADERSLMLELLLEAGALAAYVDDHEREYAIARQTSQLPAETDAERFIVSQLTSSVADHEGDFARAQMLWERTIELAERLDRPRHLLWAAEGAMRAGHWGDGLPLASRAVRVARERGLVSTLPQALQVEASQLVGRSQFDLAYASAEESQRLVRDLGHPVTWSVADLATIDAIRGDEQRAREHIAESEALVASSGARLVGRKIARALALLDLGMGRPSAALDRLLKAVVDMRPESDYLFVLGVPDAVEAGSRTQRLEEVAPHLDLYRKRFAPSTNRARLALLARCEALMDETHAERHFHDAATLSDALAPFDRARTELLYGEWLRRHRRRADARPRLRMALEQFAQLGARPWEARARSELRASGETARRRDPSTRDQLTPQELQIARLVASGKTNPEVAAQLFLSSRTIDYHLRKVFAKLDITSRTELARLDLGEPVAA